MASQATNRHLLTGGSALTIATLLANAGNYLLNVFLGRWLTTPEFADANLMVTLMLLVTAVAVSLQLIAARFAGIDASNGDRERTLSLAAGLRRAAAGAGIALGLVLAIGAPWWAQFFNSDSAWPFVILGVGMPAYLVQAVGRGVLQGRLEFIPLSKTFLWEMVVRVVAAVVLVAAGFGVIGATAALTASFLATWWVVERSLGWDLRSERPTVHRAAIEYAGPVGLVLLAQIIINNGDVLVSKQSLSPTAAGIYAAIALVGRAVFFLSWSVATTLFPAAAQRHEHGERVHDLLYAGLAAVAVLGAIAVAGSRLLGDAVLGNVFGPDYANIASPLAWYAFATAAFAMANLIVSHHLAIGELREAAIMLAGAILQTVLLIAARGATDSLVRAQVIAMLILLGAVALSHLLRRVVEQPTISTAPDLVTS